MKAIRNQIQLYLLVLLAWPAIGQAQYTFTTNSGVITITGYAGSDRILVIPGTTNGYPVTILGPTAFFGRTSLTNLTIPNTVTNLGSYTFDGCSRLQTVTLGTNLSSFGEGAFYGCASLTSLALPNRVASLGNYAFAFCGSLKTMTLGTNLGAVGEGTFYRCTNLASLTLPASVTNLGDSVFAYCSNLTGIYFEGNAPGVTSLSFSPAPNVTGYYLAGSTGWSALATLIPLAPWLPQAQTRDGQFGVQSNRFGFNLFWASGQTAVVEACTNLAHPVWLAVQTNTLTTGTAYFSEPRTNYLNRFYRVRSP